MLVDALRRPRCLRCLAPVSVNSKPERQERNLVQGHLHETVHTPLQLERRVARRGWQNAYLSKVCRVAGQRKSVANALVKAVVRASAKRQWLLLVRKKIIKMAQLVVRGDKILFRNFDAHLEPHVVRRAVGEVPSAGVAHRFARRRRLVKKRRFPETGRKLAHA